jgi:transposase
MRLTTLLKRVLRLGRERVLKVEISGEGDGEFVVVQVARPARRRMRCSRCARRVRAVYDRSIRSWRHLDLLRARCVLRAEVRRVSCPECGVVAEEVPWARPGARFTRAFEDTCVWLVKQAPKSVVAELMQIDWATVGRMIERVVDEALGEAPDALEGLRRIGLDEVSYRKGRHYLTCAVDHGSGRIVWAHPGRSKRVVGLFFDALGPERSALLEAVSVDLHQLWAPVIRERAPQARICADPFHVVRLAQEALDELRRHDWQELRREDPERARWLKGTRFILRRRADSLGEGQRALIEDLAETNERVYRGWLLLEQLRAVYRLADGAEATRLLDGWIHAAATSGLGPFVRVAITFEEHAEAIVNAIALGLSNARLEAMNSTVRLISHRSRGFRRLESLLALIQLVCGRIPVALPT